MLADGAEMLPHGCAHAQPLTVSSAGGQRGRQPNSASPSHADAAQHFQRQPEARSEAYLCHRLCPGPRTSFGPNGQGPAGARLPESIPSIPSHEGQFCIWHSQTIQVDLLCRYADGKFAERASEHQARVASLGKKRSVRSRVVLPGLDAGEFAFFRSGLSASSAFSVRAPDCNRDCNGCKLLGCALLHSARFGLMTAGLCRASASSSSCSHLPAMVHRVHSSSPLQLEDLMSREAHGFNPNRFGVMFHHACKLQQTGHSDGGVLADPWTTKTDRISAYISECRSSELRLRISLGCAIGIGGPSAVTLLTEARRAAFAIRKFRVGQSESASGLRCHDQDPADGFDWVDCKCHVSNACSPCGTHLNSVLHIYSHYRVRAATQKYSFVCTKTIENRKQQPSLDPSNSPAFFKLSSSRALLGRWSLEDCTGDWL